MLWSNERKKWLTVHRTTIGSFEFKNVLEWPSQSPNLNSIDNLWGEKLSFQFYQCSQTFQPLCLKYGKCGLNVCSCNCSKKCFCKVITRGLDIAKQSVRNIFTRHCLLKNEVCCIVKISFKVRIWNLDPVRTTGGVRLGLMVLLSHRCTVPLFITLHNRTDNHDSFCHSSPTQRLSLPFYSINWLALNLSVKMGMALRLSF